MRRSLLLAVVATAALTFAASALGATPIQSAPAFTPAQLSVYPTADWPVVGGNYQQNHYSALDQINTSNVGGLKEVFHIHLDGSGILSKYNNEATPLVWKGVMYVVTGNNDVFAFDAATGERIWKHESRIPQYINTICCGWDARGLGLGDGKIFVAQLDGKLVALDQATGQIVWSYSNARWQDGYTMTIAPLYYVPKDHPNGLVIVGVSGSEYGARGSMTAIDAKTGKRVWRFYNTPTPGEIGSGTWPSNEEWAKGGATVWNTPAADAETDTIAYSTANADPWAGRGPGDNLFTASMVGLDANTGDYAWHFQMVHHDLWDYDCPSPIMFFKGDFGDGGGVKTAAAETCKTGWMYVVNARDGNPLIQIDEKPVPQNQWNNTAATQPIPVGDAFAEQCPTGNEYPAQAPDNQPYIYGCIWTPYDDKQFVVTAPGAGGGTNWSPNAYSPQTKYIYTCSNNTRLAAKSIPNASATYVGGRTFIGIQFGAAAATFLQSGNLTAMNSLTNRKVWQKRYEGRAPNPPAQTQSGAGCANGTFATAGGLVFQGVPALTDFAVVVYNAQTGAEITRLKTDAEVRCPVMSYSVAGKQYIGVYACGRANLGTPAVKGDSVYVYSL